MNTFLGMTWQEYLTQVYRLQSGRSPGIGECYLWLWRKPPKIER